MQSGWTWALVAFALVTLALSYRVPRAWRWMAWGGASFFASTLFFDYAGRPDLHPFFTAACDGLVCGYVLYQYQEHWELGIALAYLMSVFSSCLMLGTFIHSQIVYASLLEICNLSAMICISTTGVLEMIGRDERSPFHTLRDFVRHARHSI